MFEKRCVEGLVGEELVGEMEQLTDVEIKDHYSSLFAKSFGVPIDAFWDNDYNEFDWPGFMEFLQEKYPDWMEYQNPAELEEDKLGIEVRKMMNILGSIR